MLFVFADIQQKLQFYLHLFMGTGSEGKRCNILACMLFYRGLPTKSSSFQGYFFLQIKFENVVIHDLKKHHCKIDTKVLIWVHVHYRVKHGNDEIRVLKCSYMNASKIFSNTAAICLTVQGFKFLKFWCGPKYRILSPVNSV